MQSLKYLTIAAAGLAFVGLAAPAAAFPTIGEEILVGDKIFSDFSCTITSDVGFTAPFSCDDISVLTLGDEPYGISFAGSFSALAQIIDDLEINSAIDLLITYAVRVADGVNNAITGVFLGSNPTVVGAGLANVTETIFSDSAHTEVIGQIFVQNPSGILTASTTFDPINQVFIKKDILLNAFVLAGIVEVSTATISFIDQRFTQVVPEPATLGMLGVGLMGLGFALRRRRSNA